MHQHPLRVTLMGRGRLFVRFKDLSVPSGYTDDEQHLEFEM